jgi:Ca-activated chloride channel family protein
MSEALEIRDWSALWWGVAVFALLVGFVYIELWRGQVSRELASRGPLPRLFNSSPGWRLARAVLVILGTSLVVAALMRPQYGLKEQELKNRGIDLALVIDASKSMKVRDVIPDRGEAARIEMEALLDKLSGGQVALVPVAGMAFVQTPLTADFSVIKSYLRDLRVQDMPRGGTALGLGIIEALRALLPPEALEGTIAAVKAKEGGDTEEVEVAEPAGSKYKAIVLFTDGEDHESEPIQAAQLAKELGVRIYTVGVGTTQGRPVPEVDEKGEIVGVVKGPDGTPYFSGLNTELLTEVAQITGGQYFHLGPQGLGLELVRAIDQLEKKEYEHSIAGVSEDRYTIFLAPAVVLLLLEGLLTGRAFSPRRRA